LLREIAKIRIFLSSRRAKLLPMSQNGGLEALKLQRIAPELPVSDLAESVTYYRTKLGFQVVSEFPEGRYVVLQRDYVAIHLFEERASSRPVGVHIFTAALDELHDELHKAGAIVTQAVERKPWGNRDFRVADPSGNQIKFTEPLSEG
jgi:catechol 2,3-dioxygenase-like lactoylglutathione lyase family enzyme